MPPSEGLSLYHFDSCPFCARVRGAMARMGLDIELRDIARDPEHRSALVEATGRQMVPCLRIETGDEVEWLFESADIIGYLEDRYATAPSQ